MEETTQTIEKKDKRNLALPMNNEQMSVIKGYQAVTNKSNSDLADDVFEYLKNKYKTELATLANNL